MIVRIGLLVDFGSASKTVWTTKQQSVLKLVDHFVANLEQLRDGCDNEQLFVPSVQLSGAMRAPLVIPSLGGEVVCSNQYTSH